MTNKHPTGPLPLAVKLLGARPGTSAVLVGRPPLGLAIALTNTAESVALISDGPVLPTKPCANVVNGHQGSEFADAAYWTDLNNHLLTLDPPRREAIKLVGPDLYTPSRGSSLLIVAGGRRYETAFAAAMCSQWSSAKSVALLFTNGWVDCVRRAASDIAYITNGSLFADSRTVCVVSAPSSYSQILINSGLTAKPAPAGLSWQRLPVRLSECPPATVDSTSTGPKRANLAELDEGLPKQLPQCIVIPDHDPDPKLIGLASSEARTVSFLPHEWSLRRDCDLLLNRTDEFYFRSDDTVVRESCYVSPPGPTHEFISFYRRDLEKIGGKCFLAVGQGHKNYFHWMVEHLPKVIIWQDLLRDMPDLRLLIPSGDTYLTSVKAVLGSSYDPDRVTSLSLKKGYRFEDALFTTRLIADASLRPSRLVDECARRLRAWAALNAEKNPQKRSRSRKLYISRLGAWRRRLLNEEELIKQLSDYDFEIISAEKLSFEDQASVFYDAEQVVAPHGAGLTNILFSGRLRFVCEIFGGTYFNPCFRSLGASIIPPAKWAFYCGSLAHSQSLNKHEFHYSIDVQRFVSKVTEATLPLQEQTST